MKRILFALIILIGTTASARAVIWHTPSAGIFSWDASTVSEVLDPNVYTDVITYEIFEKIFGQASRRSLGTVTGTSYTYTFTVPGFYVLGVRAVRTVTVIGSTEPPIVVYSPIAWLDDPQRTASGQQEGIAYLGDITMPNRLRTD